MKQEFLFNSRLRKIINIIIRNYVDFIEWMFVTFNNFFISNLHQNFISIHSKICNKMFWYFLLQILLLILVL